MQGQQHHHGIEGLVVVAGEIRSHDRDFRRAGGCDRGRVRVDGRDGVPGVREPAGQGALAASGIQDPGRRGRQETGRNRNDHLVPTVIATAAQNAASRPPTPRPLPTPPLPARPATVIVGWHPS
jgi:hypothetical protein